MPLSRRLAERVPVPLFRGEELFGLAIDAFPGGVFVASADGVIVRANLEFERQFDYGPEELIGGAIHVLLPDAMNGSRAAAGSRRRLTARRRDGTEFPAEVTLTALRSERGAFVLGSIVDATRWQSTDELVRAAIDKELEFERLIADLCHKFINLSPDQVIETMRDGLRQVGEALAVDRCATFTIHDDDKPVAPIWWTREGIAPNPSFPTLAAMKEKFPWAIETLLAGHVLRFSTTDDISSAADRASYEAQGIVAAVTIPIQVRRRTVGAIGFNMMSSARAWTADSIQRMQVIAAVFGNVLARSENDQAMRHAIADAEHQRNRLRAENTYLRREVQERVGVGSLVGQSPAMQRVFEQIRQVAVTDSTVLLLGETGTGKEVLATYLHSQSNRRGRTMVRVNCSAIPSTLIESELFGREKGAFTGAIARQIGRFELADRSTIFLDEIGDLPPEVQVKLLRVLEERQIERLGSPTSIRVDTRIVAATHRNLEKRVADETFREDLFYRLNVFPIQVPPLRERAEDIPDLVWRFVHDFSQSFAKRIDSINRESMALLHQHSWPGNIRELRNAVERAMIVATGPELVVTLPAAATPLGATRSSKLEDVEREHIRGVLESAGWRIRGAGGAAERLGLKPTTLDARMAKLRLTRPAQA